jgi:hypothetical protein
MLEISIYFSMWCQEISKGEARDVGQGNNCFFSLGSWGMPTNKTESGICKLSLLR